MVIYESMRKWCGRLKFRLYIPMKANKYENKPYKLTNPDSYVFSVPAHRSVEPNEAGDFAAAAARLEDEPALVRHPPGGQCVQCQSMP